MDPATRAERILDEALRLFAERHYGMVTVRDIAVACGINPALIYYYFESKDDLFRKTLGHAIGQLRAGYASRAAAAPDPAREISAWLDMHAAIAPTLLRMTTMMGDYAASPARDPATDELLVDFYAGEQALLEDCIERGVEAGLFRPVEVAKTVRTITLQLDGIFFASASRGDDRIEADIDDLRGLVATLLQPPTAA
jgi:AcrR family transcriptional regulator